MTMFSPKTNRYVLDKAITYDYYVSKLFDQHDVKYVDVQKLKVDVADKDTKIASITEQSDEAVKSLILLTTPNEGLGVAHSSIPVVFFGTQLEPEWDEIETTEDLYETSLTQRFVAEWDVSELSPTTIETLLALEYGNWLAGSDLLPNTTKQAIIDLEINSLAIAKETTPESIKSDVIDFASIILSCEQIDEGIYADKVHNLSEDMSKLEKSAVANLAVVETGATLVLEEPPLLVLFGGGLSKDNINKQLKTITEHYNVTKWAGDGIWVKSGVAFGDYKPINKED